jgi:hypothetical protein
VDYLEESHYSVWVKLPEYDEEGKTWWIVLRDSATSIAAFEAEDDADAEMLKQNSKIEGRSNVEVLR